MALRARNFSYSQSFLEKDIPYMKFKVIFEFKHDFTFVLKEYLKYETKRDQFIEYDRSFVFGDTYTNGELDCSRKISDFLHG